MVVAMWKNWNEFPGCTLIYTVVAMWREGNESSTRCIDVLGGGHVLEME